MNGSQLAAIEGAVNAGWNLSAQGDAATKTNVASGETVNLSNTDNNLVVKKTAASDDVTFDLARDITVDSVTTGGTKVSNDGLFIEGGPSITANGINAGGQKITNLADGDVTATRTVRRVATRRTARVGQAALLLASTRMRPESRTP